MKDFDAGRADRTPHPFRLGGQTFLAKPALGWSAMLKTMNAMGAMDTDNPTEAAMTVNQFFDTVLMKADKEKFRELLADEDNDDPVTMDEIMAVIGWLMEEYSGKAAVPDDSSSDGTNSTPDSSKDNSFSQASETDSTVSPLRVVSL